MTDGKTILALHGSLGRGRHLEGLRVALGSYTKWVAPDLPGHGVHPPWNPEEDIIEAAAKDMLQYLTKPTHLLGHSLGGYLSLVLALQRPQNVKSLTLYEPVLFAAARLANPASYQMISEGMAPFGAAIAAGDQEAAARFFVEFWDGSIDWERLPQEKRMQFTSRIGFVVATFAPLFEDSYNVLGDLANIEAPTLILYGAKTRPGVAEIMTALAEKMPNARAKEVPDADHMGPIYVPERTAENIVSFWDDVPD